MKIIYSHNKNTTLKRAKPRLLLLLVLLKSFQIKWWFTWICVGDPPPGAPRTTVWEVACVCVGACVRVLCVRGRLCVYVREVASVCVGVCVSVHVFIFAYLCTYACMVVCIYKHECKFVCMYDVSTFFSKQSEISLNNGRTCARSHFRCGWCNLLVFVAALLWLCMGEWVNE